MKINKTLHLAAATLLVAATGALTPRAEAANNDSAAVIIEWNQLAQQHIGGAPFSQLRQYAMLHIAMADAVVAIEGGYEPYKVAFRAPSGVSTRAAAAQAAHDVLFSLITAPASRDAFAMKLANDLTGIPPGLRLGGVEVGKQVAARVIAWRQNDGFATSDLPRPTPTSTLPGVYRMTPSGATQFARFGDIEPFGVLSSTQFLPAAYPPLDSPEYAAAFNEVKTLGRRPTPLPASAAGYTSTQRTALLWAGGAAGGEAATPGVTVATPFLNVTNAFRVWHNVARDVAQADSLSLAKTARLFALVSASMFDSVQTSQNSKFVYRLWRPETAIRATAPDQDDDNPLTVEDATWLPLLLTPPYSSHSSNMQCIGAGAARMLRNVAGERSITVTWYASNTVTPPATTPPVIHTQVFPTFWDAAIDEGNSRVWGGIHYQFELGASRDSCSAVADYIFDTRMQQAGAR
jgi:hypothetical protein